MPKRLAITIAGAVSLGSYEAGVLYELLRAIRTYNETTTTPVDKRIYIDVLTGASAGGMTTAIVAQRLMFDAQSLDGDFTNSLYEAWVENISLMQLVKMGLREKKWHSLFSSNLIDRIGRRMLVDSMKQRGSGPHAAVEQINGVPQKLRVGLALTNLNGVDYMIPIVGMDRDGFNYTTSVDQKLFEVTGDRARDAAHWPEMCKAAVGSGAFPAAFRPKGIECNAKDYGQRLPADPALRTEGKTYVNWIGPSPTECACSDGGVLQNQPLGLAKNLVDAAVQDRVAQGRQAVFTEENDRLYVFVAPHSVKSSAENLRASQITIAGILKQLVHVYLRQATFHDWITAEGVNQQVRFLDTRAAQLAELISRGLVDVVSLLKAADDLNAALIPYDEQERLKRLREQYSDEYQRVANSAGSQGAEAFVKSLATLEAAAQLDNRDKMRIAAVTANAQKELAGAGLSSFVGFFKKRFRQHDYWVGRTKTREYLQRTDVKAILGVGTWPEEHLWQTPLPNPSGVKMPVSDFQIGIAAIIPTIIAVVIRPALLFVLLLLLALIGGAGFGLSYLLHH